MEKGKLGIRLCFYSTLAFILAFLGYSTLLFLLAGVVLIAEKDEFTTRQVIQAFCLCIVNTLLSSILGIFDFFYKIPIFGTIWSAILSVISSIISLIVFIFCIIGIVRTAKGKEANIPLAGKFANWAYGIIVQVVPQQAYQQPYPQQAQPNGQYYQQPQQNVYSAQAPQQNAAPQQYQNTVPQQQQNTAAPDAAAQQANQSQQ